MEECATTIETLVAERDAAQDRYREALRERDSARISAGKSCALREELAQALDVAHLEGEIQFAAALRTIAGIKAVQAHYRAAAADARARIAALEEALQGLVDVTDALEECCPVAFAAARSLLATGEGTALTDTNE